MSDTLPLGSPEMDDFGTDPYGDQELQAAINTLADGGELRLMTRHNAADFVKAIARIVKAARLVANPNIKAAVASVFTKGGAGRRGQEWPIEMYPSDIARAVDAALTPGDTEQCDSLSPINNDPCPHGIMVGECIQCELVGPIDTPGDTE